MSKEIVVRTFVEDTSDYWKNRFPKEYADDLFYINSFRSVFSYADDQIVHWLNKMDSVPVYHLFTYPVVAQVFKRLDIKEQESILERVDIVVAYSVSSNRNGDVEAWMNGSQMFYNDLCALTEKQGALSVRVNTRQEAHAFVEKWRNGDTEEFVFLDYMSGL